MNHSKLFIFRMLLTLAMITAITISCGGIPDILSDLAGGEDEADMVAPGEPVDPDTTAIEVIASPTPMEAIEVGEDPTPTIEELENVVSDTVDDETVPIPTPPSFPERDLDEEGPWMVVPAAEGIYLLNDDGTGLTRWMDSYTARYINAVSPDGMQIAYVSMMEPDKMLWPELFIAELPGLDALHVTSLYNENMDLSMEMGDSNFEANRAVVNHSRPAWSPDGKMLAFMGAQDGPSSDLYVYALEEDMITRLTDGPSQGYQPVWSPDGDWIVHTGARSFGTGAGYSMTGIWAARADDSGIVTPYELDEMASDEVILGWVDQSTFLVYSWTMICGSTNLRAVDLDTLTITPIWPHDFTGVSANTFDEASRTMVFQMHPGDYCDNGGLEAGAFYLFHLDGSTEPQFLVYGEGWAEWSEEAALHLIQVRNGPAYAVTTNGLVLNLPVDAPRLPVTWYGGELFAWAGGIWEGEPVGVWVGSMDDPSRIYEERATYPIWAPDGSALFFQGKGDTLYVAYAPLFIPYVIQEGISINNQPFWVGVIQ